MAPLFKNHVWSSHTDLPTRGFVAILMSLKAMSTFYRLVRTTTRISRDTNVSEMQTTICIVTSPELIANFLVTSLSSARECHKVQSVEQRVPSISTKLTLANLFHRNRGSAATQDDLVLTITFAKARISRPRPTQLRPCLFVLLLCKVIARARSNGAVIRIVALLPNSCSLLTAALWKAEIRAFLVRMSTPTLHSVLRLET